MIKEILKKIERKEIKIGVIGLGYVGLPVVLRFARVGFEVVGFDTDQEKVNKINKGVSYISHIPSEYIKKVLSRFSATTDITKVKEVDAIIICVPTPLDKYKQPDIKYLEEVSSDIYKNLKKGHIISLESTTYPGTTREIFNSKFERTNLKVGDDYFLIYSPERENPGLDPFEGRKIPKVVGGITENCTKVGVSLYSQVIEKVIPVSSTEVAEATKLLENIYRAVNIALVNELKMLFEKMGINIWEVIEAAKTKPFGFHPFYPGPGLGGHCIPIDPFYLTWKAKEYDFSTRFIELAGEINTSMPYYVVEKCIEALNKKGISIKEGKILLIGIAYKKDVDDIRESPTIKILKILKEKGFKKVDYYDPYVKEVKKTRQFPHAIKSISFSPAILKKYNAGIVVTDHSNIDYELLSKILPVIVDTRNVYKDKKKNVFKA